LYELARNVSDYTLINQSHNKRSSAQQYIVHFCIHTISKALRISQFIPAFPLHLSSKKLRKNVVTVNAAHVCCIKNLHSC